MGPLRGLLFMRLRRKRSYFIFWRTRPPEMLISSHRTSTCAPAGRVSRPPGHFLSQGQGHKGRTASKRTPVPATLTIFSPFSSCLATMDARRPSMCPRASMTTAWPAHTPQPPQPAVAPSLGDGGGRVRAVHRARRHVGGGPGAHLGHGGGGAGLPWRRPRVRGPTRNENWRKPELFPRLPAAARRPWAPHVPRAARRTCGGCAARAKAPCPRQKKTRSASGGPANLVM